MMTQEDYALAYEQGFENTVRFLICKGILREVAEEMAQSAWTRGWEARRQLEDEQRVLAWVNSIAFRTYCNESRRRRRHSQLPEVADSRHSPSSCCAQIDAARLMDRCSGLDRALLRDRYLLGFEMEAIAERRRMSAGAVRVRIHRCKAALRCFLLGRSSGKAGGKGLPLKAPACTSARNAGPVGGVPAVALGY